ncbi:tyrosine-type recombinase/integrase [Thomasclavelia sp.]|uniref:site-specific integrase n=1 Tax=Thomasclavelia sp. TaxID=3025757 RepID=UPI0025D9783B|nr:tyrosine-type recombinase/integrase [Thomasclavelia sp.]
MSVSKYMKKVKTSNGYKEVVQWQVYLRYKDLSGKTCKKHKRGFSQKKEAVAWEKHFLSKVENSTDITFRELYERYIEYLCPKTSKNICKIKGSSLQGKVEIYKLHILPYFENRNIHDIKAIDIVHWHEELACKKSSRGNQYLSLAYLKKIHGQLSAIFNFAVKFYGLKKNPANIAGNFDNNNHISKVDFINSKWWNAKQYQEFAEAAMDDDVDYHLFETLFWNGVRIGEALALRKKDFDFENNYLYIRGNASGKEAYWNENDNLEFRDTITTPKNGEPRRIKMIKSYAEEMQDYIRRLYNLKDEDFVFPIHKKTVQNHWRSIWKKTNLPYMKLHGLRHSHISLLFSLGFNVVEIARRTGHKEQTVTYMYAELLDGSEDKIIKRLDELRKEVN